MLVRTLAAPSGERSPSLSMHAAACSWLGVLGSNLELLQAVNAAEVSVS